MKTYVIKAVTCERNNNGTALYVLYLNETI